MSRQRTSETHALARRLLTSMLDAIERVDELAPRFPDETHEARDPEHDMTVADFLERLSRHSLQHRHEIAAVRAAVGAARPTDPGDTDPRTGEPYANGWYHWFLLEALLRRAELVSELVGLPDGALDRKPAPEHVAGNERSIRDVCDHVLRVEQWLLGGIERGITRSRR